MKQPLIILTGPTAVGKTDLSIRVAKAVNGEIISADSMQVYKRMDIGSAKIMPEEMDGIMHYLVDAIEPTEAFHVVRFQEMAKQALETIYKKGKLPIIVGGTGFYIQALLYDIDFTQANESIPYRQELEALAKQKGTQYLHEMLEQADPSAAKEIHANNIKRMIRALEYYHLTGERISEHNARQRQKKSPYQAAYFVLNRSRPLLYERINMRVDRMMELGLLEEVKRLKACGCTSDMVSMKGLGYKELLDYLDGKYTLQEAVDTIKQSTRHFAKRQITWFKREKDVIWMDMDAFSEEKQLEQILEICRERGIIN